jgi:hypothetical protein
VRAFTIALAAMAWAAISAASAEARTPHHAAHAGTAAAVHTGRISGDEADAVTALTKRGLALQAALNGAIASIPDNPRPRRHASTGDAALDDIECFQLLEGVTVELTGNLKELLVGAATAHLARDPEDRDTSMKYTRLALDDVEASVDLIQKITSGPPPLHCAASRAYRDAVTDLQTLAVDARQLADGLYPKAIPQ